MSVSPEECAELAEKYATLAELRRARAKGDAIPEREVFRSLARRFPGCLNELDTLPLEDIEQRALALDAAAKGGEREPWMEWVADYHRLLRAAFAIKARVRGRRPIAPEEEKALIDAASRAAGVPIDVATVRFLTTPVDGRVVPVVLERIAALHGAPVAEVRGKIFARRR